MYKFRAEGLKGLSKQPNGQTIMPALEKSIEATDDCKFRRTFHSDQGWAYQMKAYSQKLKEHNIFQNISRKGNCIDNSPMKNFFWYSEVRDLLRKSFSKLYGTRTSDY